MCVAHGGRAPQVRAAARRRLEAERVQHELGKLLADLEGDYAQADPIEVLVEQVRRAAAMTAVLGVIVARLDPDRELWGRERVELAETPDGQVPVETGLARPHIAVEMYRQWSTEAARRAKLALDAGVDERRVQLAERYGEQIAAVLRTALVGIGKLLGVDLLGREDVLGVVRQALTSIDVDGREVA